MKPPPNSAKNSVSVCLTWEERLHHRDQLREARYSALADAEGFSDICFAIEALGLRLLGAQASIGKYRDTIARLASDSSMLSDMPKKMPSMFGSFDALYDVVRKARNDAMHTGAYARHATTKAIELCIGLEEALMRPTTTSRRTVADFMVRSPITVEAWQPIARARQLMLTYSLSYLPTQIDGWKLVSEMALARFLHRNTDSRQLATNISDAAQSGLELLPVTPVRENAELDTLLIGSNSSNMCSLWIVVDGDDRLCGVLSPFDLM